MDQPSIPQSQQLAVKTGLPCGVHVGEGFAAFISQGNILNVWSLTPKVGEHDTPVVVQLPLPTSPATMCCSGSLIFAASSEQMLLLEIIVVEEMEQEEGEGGLQVNPLGRVSAPEGTQLFSLVSYSAFSTCHASSTQYGRDNSNSRHPQQHQQQFHSPFVALTHRTEVVIIDTRDPEDFNLLACVDTFSESRKEGDATTTAQGSSNPMTRISQKDTVGLAEMGTRYLFVCLRSNLLLIYSLAPLWGVPEDFEAGGNSPLSGDDEEGLSSPQLLLRKDCGYLASHASKVATAMVVDEANSQLFTSFSDGSILVVTLAESTSVQNKSFGTVTRKISNLVHACNKNELASKLILQLQANPSRRQGEDEEEDDANSVESSFFLSSTPQTSSLNTSLSDLIAKQQGWQSIEQLRPGSTAAASRGGVGSHPIEVYPSQLRLGNGAGSTNSSSVFALTSVGLFAIDRQTHSVGLVAPSAEIMSTGGVSITGDFVVGFYAFSATLVAWTIPRPTRAPLPQHKPKFQSVAGLLHDNDVDDTTSSQRGGLPVQGNVGDPEEDSFQYPDYVYAAGDQVLAGLAKVEGKVGQSGGGGIASASSIQKTSYSGNPGPSLSKQAWQKKNATPDASKSKPITFHSNIKSSGYSQSNNTPWSVQQARKNQLAAKTKKGGVGGGTGAKKAGAAASNNQPTQYPDLVTSGSIINEELKKSSALLETKAIHTAGINVLEFDARGDFLISGSNDCTGNVLKLPSVKYNGEGYMLKAAHKSQILSADVSLHLANPLVVLGSGDGKFSMWAPTRGRGGKAEEPLINLDTKREVTKCRFFYNDQLVSVSTGSTIKLFKYQLDLVGGGDLDRKRNDSTTELLSEVKTNAQTVTSFDSYNAFLSNSIVYAGSNKCLGLHDVVKGVDVCQWPDAHERNIHSVEVFRTSRYSNPSSGDLHTFATAGLDGTAKLWDMRQPGGAIRIFSSHANTGCKVGLAQSPCGQHVAVGSESRCFYIYDRGTGGVVDRVGHGPGGWKDTVSALRYHPTQAILAAGGNNGQLKFYGTK